MDSYVSIVSPMYPSADPTPADTYSQWCAYYSTLSQLPSLGFSDLPGSSYPQLPNDPAFWNSSSNSTATSSPATPFNYFPLFTPPDFQSAITPMYNFPGLQNFWTSYPIFIATPSTSTPPAPPIQPATPVSRPVDKNSPRNCTNCQVTETVRWRNITTNVVCNACFVYERKYKKCRPTTAIKKMQVRKDQATPY